MSKRGVCAKPSSMTLRRSAFCSGSLMSGTAGGVQIFHRTDRRVFVGKVIIGQVDDRFIGFSVGTVVVALAALFLDGQTLIVEIGLRNSRRPHTVGLEKNS